MTGQAEVEALRKRLNALAQRRYGSSSSAASLLGVAVAIACLEVLNDLLRVVQQGPVSWQEMSSILDEALEELGELSTSRGKPANDGGPM